MKISVKFKAVYNVSTFHEARVYRKKCHVALSPEMFNLKCEQLFLHLILFQFLNRSVIRLRIDKKK